MKLFSDFIIIETLNKTNYSIINLVRNKKDEKSYILKEIRSSNPSASEIARFKQEYNIIKNANIDGTIEVHDIISSDNKIALVLEHFNAVSLKSIIKKSTLNMKTFLEIGITLTETLSQLHAKNILHLDIKPNNILINLEQNIIKLTDFGISKILTNENNEIYSPKMIEGTLVYISPEQTGRTNSTVDHRTDLYSLGITFYEMLTGTLPFISSDPIEIIHAHIARTPQKPKEINAAIPDVINDIILKLMEKIPEERYQSALGLKADLQKCLNFVKKQQSIPSFELQKKDIMIKFSSAKKIFGRENDIEILLNAFEKTSGGESQVVTITGDPGSGKSSLVDEIHNTVINRNGFFISGRYEEFNKNIPFSSIIQAFKGLTRQILTMSENQIEHWRIKLQEALGDNGKVITNVIPEVELIIGVQPQIIEGSPEQTQNIFNLVFSNFIKIFATPAHPLVLFLDDLHLADHGSLNFLNRILLNNEINNLLVVVAYKKIDFNADYSILKIIDQLKENKVSINEIDLKPLDVKTVIDIITHALRCDEQNAAQLAYIIHEKTNGIPFFVHQFLKTIYDKKMIKIDSSKGWVWNLDKIRNESVTDNVAGLIAEKIIELPERTQSIVKTCSCIGNCFDLETISSISGLTIEKVLEEITLAINHDLMYTSENVYRFLHDRIQKAAYSLLSDDEKSRLHYSIGNHILSYTYDKQLFDRVLYIVDQLNAGKNQITSNNELYELAQLNLVAGKKAKQSTAYYSSLNYLKKGISLLNENSWNEQYQLTLELFTEASEAAYLDTKFDEMEEFSKIALQNAKNTFDTIKLYEIKTKTLMAQNKLMEALLIALKILGKLQLKIKKYPNLFHIGLELIKTKFKLIGRTTEYLYNLPITRDPHMLAGFRIISSIGSVSYWARPNMPPILACITVRKSIENGNCPESAFAYGAYGLISIGIGEINSGYEFGKMSIRLVEKLNIKYQYPRVHFVWNCYIRHWKEHINQCLDPLEVAHNKSLEVGDTEFAGHTAMAFLYSNFLIGVDLPSVYELTEKYRNIVVNLKQQTSLNVINMTRQTIQNLMGRSGKPAELKGDIYDCDIMLKKHIEAGDHTSITCNYLFKLILCYHFKDYERGIINAQKCEKGNQSIIGTALFGLLYFYDSLVRLAIFDNLNTSKKRKYLRKINRNQKKLLKWSKHAAMNYKHKYDLIEAELAQINDDYNHAMYFYDSAIDGAQKNGYINEQALAFELAGKYLLSKGKNRFAGTYLNEAVQTYRKWGARKKVEVLKKEYAQIIDLFSNNYFETTGTDNSIFVSNALDFSAIMNAALALSSEIELNKILEKILQLSLTHGGAQKCYLILENENDKKLYIEASGGVDEEIKVLLSKPIEKSTDLSIGIVNYVHKLKEGVVLNDAARKGIFTNDPYILKNKTKSLLCTPIMQKGSSTVILYLENNVSVGAFSQERLNPLRILSSQAAISIENSRLLVHRENSAKLSREIEIAARIQTSLVPDKPTLKDCEIEAYIKPAHQVGGDYYDFINIEGHSWIIIGDVSGHGVSSGLIMMMAQTSIRSVLTQNPGIEPSNLLSVINSVLHHNIKELNETKYMTITVMAYKDDGKIYHSGLHQDILIYRADRNDIEIIQTKGMWIGITDRIKNSNSPIELNKNDVMLLYTDGITEAWEVGSVKDFRTDEQMFGDEQLREILRNNGKSSPREIIEKINKSLEGYYTEDDMTLVAIKRIQ